MEGQDQRPQISPYVFPVLLAGFGLWCFWDGWLTSKPAMQEPMNLWFNRIASAVLLPWAAWDFYLVRKRERAASREPPRDNEPPRG